MSCDKSVEKVKSTFDSISSYYDKINNLMSLGTHYIIKYFALKSLIIKNGSMVLDLCCGTGDFTKIFSCLSPSSKVIGLDNSLNMLKLAKSKNPNKAFIQGDCLNLPFGENEFDIVTIGFGLRNIQDRTKALSEINRIIKNGGQFLHLDFGKHNIFSKIFDLYVKFLSVFFIKNPESYLYLIESKNEYPEPDELINEFENSGFKLLKRRDFIFGIISAQVFVKCRM